MQAVYVNDTFTFLLEALLAIGLARKNAEQIAEVMMDSELRGHTDHGIFSISAAIRWHKREGMNPDPKVSVLSETGIAVTIDGDNGCGVMAMNLAVDRVLEKAATSGFGMAVVRNTGNPIALAHYVQKIADRGFIGFACTASPNVVIPPPGGLTQTMGTNPLAFAAPAGPHLPFILDMSTSAIAGVKLYQAALNEDTIAAGLVEDADGNSMTDPSQFKIGASLILPLAGPKGYGLAMMVNVLSAVLADADRGHFVWALDVSQFLPEEAYRARMAGLIEKIKSARKKAGVEEIFYPGERGQRRKQAHLASGVLSVTDLTWDGMRQVSNYTKVPLPAQIAADVKQPATTPQ